MKLKLRTSALLIGACAVFSVVSPVYADGHGHGHSHPTPPPTQTTHLFANPTGTVGQGQVEYKSNSNKSGVGARITLPVDGTTLLDSNAAATASVTLQFPNSNPSVTCTLVIKEINFKYTNNTPAPVEAADYLLAVNSNDGAPGNCTAADNTPAIPSVVAGDPVNVLLDGNQIMTGNFH